MGVALRILGFVVFVAAVAGATWGAYEAFPPEDTFSAVELQPGSEGPVSVLAGSPTPVTIRATNAGDSPVTLVMSASEEGFEFQLDTSPVVLEANASRTLRGTLTVPDSLEGSHEVRLVAQTNDTGKRVGVLRLPVTVGQSVAPEIDIVTGIPGVIPGEEVSFQVQVANPASAPQRVSLALEDAEGTIEPATLQLSPNGTGSARVSATVPAVDQATFEPVVRATNAAGKSATASFSFRVVGQGQLLAQPLFETFEVTAGSRFSVPVVVVSNVQGDHALEVTADGLVEETLANVTAGASLGGFVTLSVPDGFTGETTRTLTVTAGEASTEATVTAREPASSQRAGPQDQATVNYVGRLTDGRVFDTSIPEVMNGPFPKTDTFRPRPNPQPFTVSLNPQAGQVITGFRDAIDGLHVGETTTAVLSPSEAYGPARVHQNVSATTEVPRTEEVPRLLEDFPRNQLPPSFEIDQKEVGDTITHTVESGGVTITFVFELVEKNERTVTLKRMEQVGDTTTFYPAWPNATEVTEVTEDTIVFRTTPPEDAGNFTWNVNPQSHPAKWGATTTVQSVDETTIVLHHGPEEGITYQLAGQPGAPPQQWAVQSVTDEQIHVSAPNPSPLGGQTLVFDVYLLAAQPAQQAGAGGVPGGG